MSDITGWKPPPNLAERIEREIEHGRRIERERERRILKQAQASVARRRELLQRLDTAVGMEIDRRRQAADISASGAPGDASEPKPRRFRMVARARGVGHTRPTPTRGPDGKFLPRQKPVENIPENIPEPSLASEIAAEPATAPEDAKHLIRRPGKRPGPG